MIKLNCMELSDCFTPEQLVDEIYRQCPDLKQPIPVEELAKASGILAVSALPTDELEGLLVADDGKSSGVIYYKDSSPLGRQRFTIGHELGHFLLLHHGSRQSCTVNDIKLSSNSFKDSESEANQFAQLLLMPEHLVSPEINSSALSLELLKSVADGFEMSFEAIANTCTGYSETPYALVYSKDGVVRYCWRDKKRFPFWVPLKLGDCMPLSSQINRCDNAEESITEVVKVESYPWIKTNSRREMPDKVFEQTYTQRDGYQVTMIRL